MGRKNSKPYRTGILQGEDEAAVDNNIKHLFERVVSCQLDRHDITREDIEEVFLPPERRQLAYDAVKVLGISPSCNFTTSIGDTTLRIRPPGLKWRYPEGRPINTRCEGYDKLFTWYNKRLAIGDDWGLVQAVFDALNQHCKRVDYIRYYWPAITTLLGDQPLADKLRQWKPCSNPTPIPGGLRVACNKTMQIVAMASLLPPASDDDNPVELSLEGMPKVRCPWPKPGTEDTPQDYARM